MTWIYNSVQEQCFKHHTVSFSLNFEWRGEYWGELLICCMYMCIMCVRTLTGGKRGTSFIYGAFNFKKESISHPLCCWIFEWGVAWLIPTPFYAFETETPSFCSIPNNILFFSSFEYGVIFSVRPFLSRCQAEHTQFDDDDENHICTFSFIPMDDTAFYVYWVGTWE